MQSAALLELAGGHVPLGRRRWQSARLLRLWERGRVAGRGGEWVPLQLQLERALGGKVEGELLRVSILELVPQGQREQLVLFNHGERDTSAWELRAAVLESEYGRGLVYASAATRGQAIGYYMGTTTAQR